MRQDILHHYRRLRAHQLATYSVDNDWVDGKPLRRTFSGGGNCHGEHAAAALAGARRHVAFLKDLADTVAKHEKRSKAAKRGHKTRKLAQRKMEMA
jgi:hypothetical protein